jgi:hypothetical protein
MKSISTKITKVLKHNNTIELCLKILATLTIIGTTLYGVNDLLTSLFDSILGKCLLVVFIGFIGLNDIRLGIFTGLLFITVYIYYITIFKNNETNTTAVTDKKTLEGFEWSKSNIDNFVKVQKTINPKHQFDVKVLQTQVSDDEVSDFLANGKWTWSKETRSAYETALDKNPYVRMYKTDGLNQAQQVYNEYAINYILDNQATNVSDTNVSDTNVSDTNVSNTNISNTNLTEMDNIKDDNSKLPSGWGDFGQNSGLI